MMINIHLSGLRTPVLMILLTLALMAAAQAESTAWQEIFADRPDAVDDPEISALERRILQVLTPEQAEAYAAGQAAESLVIPGGETLAAFIERSHRLEASGLLYKPLVPCRILDSRRTGTLIGEGDVVYLKVRGPRSDYSSLGGSADGCGVPGLRGDVLLTNTARALMLSVEVDEAAGSGTVELWPAGGARRPGVGLVTFSAQKPSPRQTIVIPTCGEESSEPCRAGDVALAVHDVPAHVIIDVVGYFEPPWNAIVSTATAVASKDSTSGNSGQKSTSAPYWEPASTAGDIHYSDGDVGINTSNPIADLHVHGSFHLSDPITGNALVRSLRRQTDGYAGGGPHDLNAFQILTPYQDVDNNVAFQGIGLASPEAWGSESTYLYAFGGKNLRLGIANDNWRNAEIEIFNDNSSNGSIFFRTGQWRDPDNTPELAKNVRMAIDRQGQVGVGIMDPLAALDVRSPANNMQIRMSDYGGSENAEMGYFNNSNKNYFTIQQNAGGESNSFFIKFAGNQTQPVFQFDTNTNPSAMVITEGGNVGIGTTSPASSLDVSGDVRAHQLCDETGLNCKDVSSGWTDFENANTLDGLDSTDFVHTSGGVMTGELEIADTDIEFTVGGSLGGRIFGDLEGLTLSTLGSNRVHVDSQNVGIGVADPLQSLEVSGAVKIGNTTTATQGSIRWTGSDFEGFVGGSWKSLTSSGLGFISSATGQVQHGSTIAVPSTANFVIVSVHTPVVNASGESGELFLSRTGKTQGYFGGANSLTNSGVGVSWTGNTLTFDVFKSGGSGFMAAAPTAHFYR